MEIPLDLIKKDQFLDVHIYNIFLVEYIFILYISK